MNVGKTASRSRRSSPCGNVPKSLPFILGLFCIAAYGVRKTPDPQFLTLASHEDVTKALVIVNRHGARSALQHFTFEDFTWDVPLGQLSVLGMHQAFEFGVHLRKEHYLDNQIPKGLSQIAAFSTYIDRTTETARAIILGIAHGNFSLADRNSGNCSCRVAHEPAPYACIEQCLGISDALHWNNALPKIHVIARDAPEIAWMMQFDRCKGFSDAVDKIHRSEDFLYDAETNFNFHLNVLKQVIGGDEACKDQVAQISNKDEHIPLNCTERHVQLLEEVWDDMTTAFYAKKDVPSLQTTPTYILNLLEEVVLWKWHQEFSNENGKLAGGILINEILDRISAAVEQSTISQLKNKGPQTVIFSSHDKTVASLLSVMGVENWHFPHYVSYIKFTVKGPQRSRALSDHHLEIEYDGKSVSMDACKNGRCTLDSFMEKIKRQRLPHDSCDLLP